MQLINSRISTVIIGTVLFAVTLVTPVYSQSSRQPSYGSSSRQPSYGSSNQCRYRYWDSNRGRYVYVVRSCDY